MTNEEFLKSITLEGEMWKDVAGYEGCYMVSNFGRVMSLGREPCNQPHDISSCIQIFSYLSIGKSHNDNLPEHGIGFTNCTGLASTQLYTVRFGLHG